MTDDELEIMMAQRSKYKGRFLLRYLEGTPAQRVRLILRAIDPTAVDIGANARNMLISEGIRDWIEGGNQKMGDIIMSKIIPQVSEHKRTADFGDNALAMVQGMTADEKRKMLGEAMLQQGDSPVKADYEVE